MELICRSEKSGLEGVPPLGVGSCGDAVKLARTEAHAPCGCRVLRPDIRGATEPGCAEDEELAVPRFKPRFARDVRGERDDTLQQLRMPCKRVEVIGRRAGLADPREDRFDVRGPLCLGQRGNPWHC